MPNVNRMLVTEHQPHTTEEREIEDEIESCMRKLRNHTARLDDCLFNEDWKNAGDWANGIVRLTEYVIQLEYRLVDVKAINAQFERIQTHIDRIEAQLKEE